MKTNRILGLLLAVFALGLAGCGSDGPPGPPRPPKVKVTAKKNEKPAPPANPAPEVPEPPSLPELPEEPAKAVTVREKSIAARAAGSATAIKLTAIRSNRPHSTKEQALADALAVARTELMKQLELLEPPIHARPTMVTMRNNYVKGDVREILPTDSEKQVIKDNRLNSNVRWVEIDLELSEDQVQRLRSSGRVTDAFRVGALLFALVGALYGFLRLDQWTKGYLTMWLGLAAGAAVLVVGLLVLG